MLYSKQKVYNYQGDLQSVNRIQRQKWLCWTLQGQAQLVQRAHVHTNPHVLNLLTGDHIIHFRWDSLLAFGVCSGEGLVWRGAARFN